MKITVLSVGKLKETYWKEAAGEYIKRIKPYVPLSCIETPDEKDPDRFNASQLILTKRKEGERLKEKINPGDFVVALDLKGKEFSSEGFSSFIQNMLLGPSKDLVFIIGGSLGLDDDILSRSNLQICFSKMTFPHQLMRIILLEQLYRGFKIMRGEPYHK